MITDNKSARGTGFIISSGALAPKKSIVENIGNVINVGHISKIKQGISDASSEIIAGLNSLGICCRKAFYESSKNAARLFSGFALALIGATLFFKYYTFAAAVYSSEGIVTVVSSEKIADKTISEASALVDAPFHTSVILSPRSKISDFKNAKSALLLSSGKYCRGYNLISNGKRVYTASSKKIAARVLDEYVAQLSMNGKAKIDGKVEIVPVVCKREQICSADECINLIGTNHTVGVVSIVDNVYDNPLPYDVTTNTDDTLFLGENVIVSEGKEGIERIHTETVYKNGLEESKRVSSSSIVAAPVSKIVRTGTRQKDISVCGVIKPANGTVSSPFGPRWGKSHKGMDFAVPIGSDVLASQCGTVCYIKQDSPSYGKIIKIDHGFGIKTAYAHLSEVCVSVGQNVAAGEIIAKSGNSGNSTGPHLHFEIIKNGTQVDPAPYIR